MSITLRQDTTTPNAPQLTLQIINKELNHWINKQEKSQILNDRNFITTSLQFVFNIIKESFQNRNDSKYKFQDILKKYIGLFLSTGNNQHRYLVQLHLKNILDVVNFDRYKNNQKLYIFLCKIFYYYPFLVFRILQSKYKDIFGPSNNKERVNQLYALYIKFANTRKNEKLIEDYIQTEINQSNSLEKLNILLRSYNSAYRKIIKQQILLQIIDIIDSKNEKWILQKSEERDKILNFCQTMYVINWPLQMQQKKPSITINMIKVWEKSYLSISQKLTINNILQTISVNQSIVQDLKLLIRIKIHQKSKDFVNFGLNSNFVKIIISKFDRQQSESIIQLSKFIQMIDDILAHESTCQQKIQLLQTIRVKKIFDLSKYIQKNLTEIIRNNFTFQYGGNSQLTKEEGHRLKQIIFALKIIRIYNFDDFQSIYELFKKQILKNKSSKQCHIELKKQILLVCLYILKHKASEDEEKAFKDILDLIGQQIELKIMMITYIVQYLSQRFYNQGQIYNIYKQSKYQFLLYEDYTTNDMVIKIFSIKTICYLASDVHSQYTFFLKNAYYQLFDRLSIKFLINSEEQEICLKLIRQIMRNRAQLFENQADQLNKLLLSELHKSIQFHSPQTNSISIIIFKIFQTLLNKIPLKMISFAKSIIFYIINIMNFKILKKQLKKIAIETFCDMIYNCNYVILPYFHFKNLYLIIKEVLRSDDHCYYYRPQLLRLIGKLGYINQENFVGMQDANIKDSKIDEHFENVFEEITFIKNIKDKKYSKMQINHFIIDDAFYSEQKITKSCIQIGNYRYYILNQILRNITQTSLQVKIAKTLKTIQNIIPVLNQAEDQKILHELLLDSLFEIQSKYSNETLQIVLEILCYHQLQQQHCKKILKFYLPKIPGHKKQLQLIKLLCVITDKYKEYVNDQLINIIIVAKKIVMDNYSTKHEEYKIKLCFSIFINLADKVDHILHLFFIDLNKIFSNKEERREKDQRGQKKQRKNAQHLIVPYSVSSDFFTLLIHLTKKCPSIQYFLPSIRQCLIDYLHQQVKLGQCKNNKFLNKIINTMICLMIIYGKRCESFINILQWSIKKHNIYHIFYRISLDYFKKHSNLDYLSCAFTQNQINELFHNDIKTFSFQKSYKDLQVDNINTKILRDFQKISIQENHTEEQQDLWMDSFSTELFSHSKEPILRACIDFVTYDKLFAFDILDVPFYFFWKNLTPQEQSRMTLKIKNILMKKTISLRVRQKFLDAIYFIERCQIPFIIKDKLLSDFSVDVEDQVKALFYLERQYENDPQLYRECLCEKYSQIGEKQSALGLFKKMKLDGLSNPKLLIKLSSSNEQFLRQFEGLKENLQGMGKKQKNEKISPIQLEIKRGSFNWQAIIKDMNLIAQSNKSKFAHFAIESAINLGNWEQVNKWAPYLQQENSNEEVSLWNTMIKIHDKKYQDAQKLIIQIRQKMYYKIRQMFSFSYEKSMKGVLLLQQISEIQQILQFNKYVSIKQKQQEYINKKKKQQSGNHELDISLKKKQLISVWNDRFEGLKNNLNSIQKILFVRGLLLTKTENIDHWITFCKLALSENKKPLGKKIFNILNSLTIKDEIKLLQLKSIHHEIEINDCMSTYFDALIEIESIINEKKLIEDKVSIPLIVQIYYKYAQGIIEAENMTRQQGKRLVDILDKFLKEKGFQKYYELSHIIGLTHIKILQIYNQEMSSKKIKTQKKAQNISKDQDNDSFRKQEKSNVEQRKIHLQEALKCFLSSVTNSARQNKYFLQDCLKILNMISMGNQGSTLFDIFQSRYQSIPSQGLIQFIPQIIARLDNNYGQNQKYISILKKLLVFIGINHPQALIFPLIFLRRGNNLFKKKHADQIYIEIIEQNQIFQSLYKQGELIVEQLCKISLKLSQKVYIFMSKILKMLRETRDKNMLISQKIIQFCQKILQQNEKLSSQSQFGFIQQQKQTLINIVESLKIYTELQQIFFFNQAIKLIKQIVNQTQSTLNFIKTIYLQQASIKLSKIKKSNVCLFGKYTPYTDNVTIDSFKNQIQVITSKQRPKKFVIIGTDNKHYNYLLKGKEDLRLDERIMQLFCFINKMFHSPTQIQNYSIQGYSITPINFQIGIISWVQDCDTIGNLIADYRISNNMGRNIQQASNLEYKMCLQICSTYQNLAKYQKVEIFKDIQKKLSGNDLKIIFWKRCVTSQKWLKSRSCFTRSLAVMSIVGYMIGLGDRHPFNIMLHRETGKIVHIDFGDCFQVTKMKTYYPQKVPFRLTRMLVNAMEPCKTDGIFKHTCQKIMKILRNNKESILVIVEAFRYDPLIGWKITSKGDKEDQIMIETTDYELLQASEEKSKIKSSEDQIQSTKHILNNIKNKLNGIYEKKQKPLSQAQHVEKLIKQAISPLNLVQHYRGWLIYW